MYQIRFFRDRNGKEPVLDFLRELESRQDKNSRVVLKQMIKHIRYLQEYGTRAGEKITKHLDGEIWEPRPDQHRILFAAWYQGSFVLLHTFLKQTQKTPRREIEQAKRELAYRKEAEKHDRK